MRHSKTILAILLLSATTLLGGATAACAQAWTNSAGYNGYGASSQNTPSSYQMRDPAGKLTVVNGQFTPSSYSSQSGTQSAHTSGGGVGTGGAGAQYGQASAIGNSLNVVVLGSHNTTVVDAQQINNGNQTASVDLNSH